MLWGDISSGPFRFVVPTGVNATGANVDSKTPWALRGAATVVERRTDRREDGGSTACPIVAA